MRAKGIGLALRMLFILALFALPTAPALAQQGVAIEPYWQAEVGGDLKALAIDDLDGDGWAEIITGTDKGQVTLWRAEGEAAWTFDVETDWVTGLSVGDLEGDGNREVFATAAGILPTSYVYVLRAGGRLLWSHSVRGELWGVVLLDLDQDERQEVLLVAQRPVVLDDDGSELKTWSGQVNLLATPSAQVADLDGDGAREILTVGASEVTIIEADGASRDWPHGLDARIVAARAADLDGDGRGEVIVATETDVALFQEDGRLGWTHRVDEPPGELLAEEGVGVLVGSGSAVVQLTAGGDEAWRYASGPSDPSAAFGLDAADPDADGRSETVFGTSGGQVHLLDADGAPMAEYAVAGRAALVRYADLNGDAHGEVLVGAEGVLSVFGCPGGATTRLRWANASRGAVTDLSVGDVNGDGWREVVVGGRDKKVTLLDREGTMVWQFAAVDVVDSVDAGRADASGKILIRAGRHLYLLSGDGVLLWERTFHNPLRAVVWTMTREGTTTGPAGIAVGLEDGRAMLLAPEDGSDRRSYRFDRAVQAVGVSEEMPGLVVGLGDGRVARLDAGGALAWEQDIGRVVNWLDIVALDSDRQQAVIARSGDNVYQLQADDGSMLWRTNTRAERIVGVALQRCSGDGQGCGVVVGTDRRVYQLDATGVEAWSHPLEDVPSAVYADGWFGERVSTEIDGAPRVTLVSECGRSPSGCGRIDVAVGTVKGGIYLLDGDGQLLWQGQGRERINALRAGDLNGDGRQELLAGMEDGLVHAYGLVADQVPWLSAPRVTPVGGGYVYSVQVHDPDGDDVRVALEIWDPSAGTWLAQEKSSAPGGTGILSWNLPNPFDTWDAGRDSRFRFIWHDGQTEGTVAAVSGPLDIPVAPWYVFYGRYALALAVVGAIPTLLVIIGRRTRAYRLSPVGRAEAFLLRLTLEPETLLQELHQLVTDESRGRSLLPHLPGLARQAGDEMLAGLTEGYYLVLTHPDRLRVAEGLKTIVGALAGEGPAPLPKVEWKRETHRLYDLLLAALQANSVSRIAALRDRLGSLVDMLEELDASPKLSTSFFLVSVAPLLAQLARVSRTLTHFEQVESSGDQIAYLVQAVEILGRCDRRARADLADPEQTIAIHIVANWLGVVTRALTRQQGRAKLTIALKTRRAVADGGEIVLVLALNNVGLSPASNLTVELLPGEQYTVNDGRAKLAVLPSGRTADVDLRVRPSSSVDTFRAEFRITYDDREREGKTKLFADRVRLLTPSTVFRPIPNPYATGRPLRAGSPVFFGREDVFAFIRENVGGPGSENVLVLVGERRMGKTSLLQQLPDRLSAGYVPVYLDGQALAIEGGIAGLFYDIALEICEAVAGQGIALEKPALEDLEEKLGLVFEKRFLSQVTEALGERVLLLLLDEFEELERRVRSGRLPTTIFPYLRHVMQHSEHVAFIFAGTHQLEDLTAIYWSTLFNIALYKRMHFLDMEAARRLIMDPVGSYGLLYDDLAIDKMLRVTGGHPYFLQLLCHALVNLHNRERLSYITIRDVNRTLGDVIGLGEAHLAFLWGESKKQERAVLMALSHIISAGEPGTRGAIAGLLEEHGMQTGLRDVSSAAEALARREIIQEKGPEADRYEFTVDLIRLWIDETRSFGPIVEEMGKTD